MKNKLKLIRILAFTLVLMTAFSLYSCDTNSDSSVKLSFKQALSYDYLKSINGSQVTINGYLATSSPVDGSFIFLMNLPYQSCPFCIPNTSQLSNTMEVYPKSGKTFAYTNQAVNVVGKLVVSDNENKPFTDTYGYEFVFKIVDATYTILSDEDMSADIALWQKFASTDLVTEIYSMYDYVNFLCSWNTYFVNSYQDSNGTIHNGYYLYPSDALNFVQNDGYQYNYGYKDGYFDNIIASIRKVDANAFEDLVKNIEDAKTLAEEALNELLQGNYTSEYKYVDKFETYDYIYTLNRGEELKNRMDAVYLDFSNWLGGWEL